MTPTISHLKDNLGVNRQYKSFFVIVVDVF